MVVPDDSFSATLDAESAISVGASFTLVTVIATALVFVKVPSEAVTLMS